MNKAELLKSTDGNRGATVGLCEKTGLSDGTIKREISILSQIELIRNPYQLFEMSEQLMYRKRIKQNY